MTTCTYCHCFIESRDTTPGDEPVCRHRDIYLCAAALKRRVAELEAQLKDSREAPLNQTAED